MQVSKIDRLDYGSYHRSVWNDISNTEIFNPCENVKPEQYELSDIPSGLFKMTVMSHSIPVASQIAWVFQPCDNITSCTSLKELVSEIITEEYYFNVFF